MKRHSTRNGIGCRRKWPTRPNDIFGANSVERHNGHTEPFNPTHNYTLEEMAARMKVSQAEMDDIWEIVVESLAREERGEVDEEFEF